ncbi:MAG: hypothetical protein EZS28_011975, partial [Streblomastix strix]
NQIIFSLNNSFKPSSRRVYLIDSISNGFLSTLDPISFSLKSTYPDNLYKVSQGIILRKYSPETDNYKEVEVDENQSEQKNAIENAIQDEQGGENRDVVGINVTSNEVYEEETITVPDNKAYIIQPTQENPENPPVLRPAEKTDEHGDPQTSTEPLVNIEGNKTLEIKGFIVEYFQSETTSPVLKTDGDAVLRLNNVTLSSDKRVKEGDTITAQPSSTEKTTPFLEAHGVLVVLKDVVIEPSNFISSNVILLSGSQGANNHQFLAENSNFQVQNNPGSQSFLNIIQFTVVIKGSTFEGQRRDNNNNENRRSSLKKDIMNAVQQQTCEWSTGSVSIVDGVGFFEDTTFKSLSEGALKIGKGGIVTLKNSVLLYDNKPTDSNLGRNIICGGTAVSPAQLLAESSSFSEVEPDGKAGSISRNKWVLADGATCKITGSLGQEKMLLYTPQIQSIKATGNTEKTGIDVVIEGKSLFGCGKLYLQVSAVSQQVMNADAVKQYKLEDVATTWDSDTSISVSIGADELVQRGKKLTVSVLVQTADNSLHDAELAAGGSNTVEVSGFEAEKEHEVEVEPKSGLSTGALIGIIVAAVAVVVIIVIVIICCVCCWKKSSSSDSSRDKDKNRSKYHDTKSVPMEENRW